VPQKPKREKEIGKMRSSRDSLTSVRFMLACVLVGWGYGDALRRLRELLERALDISTSMGGLPDSEQTENEFWRALWWEREGGFLRVLRDLEFPFRYSLPGGVWFSQEDYKNVWSLVGGLRTEDLEDRGRSLVSGMIAELQMALDVMCVISGLDSGVARSVLLGLRGCTSSAEGLKRIF